MNHLKGLSYDAVAIEHNFAIFMQAGIGQRGLPHDADVFRGGDVAALGEVIERFAARFEERAKLIQWPSSANGTPGARVHSAIRALRSLAADMKKSKAREQQDYHWLIVGELVLLIASLLDQMGV